MTTATGAQTKLNQVVGSLHSTTPQKLNLHMYGVFRKDDEPDCSDNCLVIAFRESGMSAGKVQR
eukprot:150583-Alexandrium_andersonii.AAC.1